MPLFSEELAEPAPNSASLHGIAHTFGDGDSEAAHANGVPRRQSHEGLTAKLEAMLLKVEELRSPGQAQHFGEALPVQRGRHRVTCGSPISWERRQPTVCGPCPFASSTLRVPPEWSFAGESRAFDYA